MNNNVREARPRQVNITPNRGRKDPQLAARLIRFRFDRGLTDQKIADLIGGLSRETIRRCRNGARLDLGSLFKIKTFLERAGAA